ncbi:dipeptidyl peptidase IV N-terminal region-domain-containing protein [Parasitella parasitica]|nr:dipeptidyl peptidase IV N-terminal region-domain-containing protein [Parasitella parasitica]
MTSRREYFVGFDQEETANEASQRLLFDEQKQRLGSNDSDSNDFYLYSEEKELIHTDYSYPKKGFNWVCLAFVSILVLAWILWTLSIVQLFTGLTAQESDYKSSSDTATKKAKRLEFEDIFNSSFTPRKTDLVWVENDPRDGIYTYRDPKTNDILLESIQDRQSQVFVKAKDLKFKHMDLDVDSFELSHDAQYLLLKTNVSSVWRHSSLFYAYIYRASDKRITQLTASSKISYAIWSPTGHQLAYVLNNDIYITDLRKHKRVTFDGSQTVFNGIPDWVYEEEVLESNAALWWAPDSSHIAFLKLDETDVPEYHLQLYTGIRNGSYPKENKIRYPKAGARNPLVSLHVYSLSADRVITASTTSTHNNYANIMLSSNAQDFSEDDRLIVDVAWATDSHTQLLFKQTNRIQDHQYTNLVNIDSFHLENSTVRLVREYKPTDGGWIDIAQSMVYLSPKNNSTRTDLKYLDILDNEDGFAHLAIITISKESSSVSWLTFGEWEVVAETVVVDARRQLVHFVSTERSPYERHLYNISLDNEDPASTKYCITCPADPEEHAYYSASFSPKSGYYILDYEGPGIPNTVVKKVDDVSFRSVLQDNIKLRMLLRDYDLPKTHFKTVSSGGVEMTAMEVVPADFDPHKKYPVLFHVYGGPGSQLVSYRFDLSWQTFVASQLGFIVVTVDGRGTGFKGRKYRVGVRGRLGELETIDQVNAGRYWAKLDYVDEYRMAIWGWSYGGYMTTKVIEADDGIFSTGMAIAPVTDWRFYDSVYTERYMKTPKLNPIGYEHSAVNNMTGFRNVKYLVAHGTGDDNVHFQHTAVLVDKLTLEDIHNYRVQIYSDSNHAIRHHNANKNLYYLLTDFLIESFGGHEYKHIYNEMHGKFSGPLPKEE